MHDKYSYRVIWSEEDGEYVGLVAEFPSLSWLAKSQEAAFRGIRMLVKEIVADMIKEKESLPEPISIKQFSGKFVVRVPPEIHRRLALAAQEEKVSLNRYVSARLAA
jgi:predicted HicB family RNase H-like nuclease